MFAAVVAVVIGRNHGVSVGAERQRREVAAHTAEGVALLAAVWIGFQAINAWRLTELWRRTFDPYMELYVLALLTAFTASVVIGLRVVLRVQESAAGAALLRAAGARRPPSARQGGPGRPARRRASARRSSCCSWCLREQS